MSVIGEAFVRIRPETAGFEKDVTGKVTGALSALGPIGAPLAGLAAATIAVGGAAFAIGEKFHDAYRTIRIGTGQTGDALEGLKGTFRGIIGEIPATFEQASQAVTILGQRTGLTGNSLKDLAEQQIRLARITKGDLTTNITETTKAFANFGVGAKDQGAALDVLFRASQRTGISVPNLAGELQKFGPILRGLGFDFNSSTALLASLDKEGIAAGPVFAGLRKAIAEFAKEGKSAPEALRATFDSIKNAKTPTEATAEALKVFGSRAGPQLADAIRGGRLAYDDLAKAIGKGDTIAAAAKDTATLSSRFLLLRNRIYLAAEPFATKVFDYALEIFDRIGEAVRRVWPTISLFFGLFKSGFTGNGVAEGDSTLSMFFRLGEMARRVFEVLRTVFEFMATHRPILLALGVAVAVLAAPFTSLAIAAVVLYARFQVVRDVVQAVVGAVVAAFGYFRDTILPILTEIADYVVGAFTRAFAFVQEISGPFIEAATHIFNVIRDIVTPIILAIEEVWRTASGSMLAAAMAIWDAIRAEIEMVIGVIENVIRLVLDIINGNWSKAWHDILAIVSTVFSGTIGVVSGVVRAILDIIGGLMAAAARGLENGVGAVLGFFGGLAGRALGAVGDIVGDFSSLGGRIIHGIADGMSAAIGAVVGFFKSIGGKIFDAVKSGLGALGRFLSPKTQFGIDLGNGILLGIQYAINSNSHLATGAMASLNAKLSALAGPTIAVRATVGAGDALGGLSVDVPGRPMLPTLGSPGTTSARGGTQFLAPLFGDGAIRIEATFGAGTNADDVKEAFRQIAQDEIAGTVGRVVELALAKVE